MDVTLDTVRIELVQGNIADQPDVDAIVNAANAQLQPGSGVAGAIHDAAGPGLADACMAHAPLQPGEAVCTDAFDLPNAHVIHVLGPVYGRDEPAAALLRACYENALDEAEARELSSIAFPAISTGAFGYPMRPAAHAALGTVLANAPILKHIELVRFVLFDAKAMSVFEDMLADLRDDPLMG